MVGWLVGGDRVWLSNPVWPQTHSDASPSGPRVLRLQRSRDFLRPDRGLQPGTPTAASPATLPKQHSTSVCLEGILGKSYQKQGSGAHHKGAETEGPAPGVGRMHGKGTERSRLGCPDRLATTYNSGSVTAIVGPPEAKVLEAKAAGEGAGQQDLGAIDSVDGGGLPHRHLQRQGHGK